MNQQLQQTQSQDKISWPTLIFEAESSNEPFKNMTIVTAKSEYITKAKDKAFDWLILHQPTFTYSEINELATSFIKEDNIQVFENASITDEGVFVCLNVEVIDDETVWTALDRVYQAVENGGKWTSNIPLSFLPSELQLV